MICDYHLGDLHEKLFHPWRRLARSRWQHCGSCWKLLGEPVGSGRGTRSWLSLPLKSKRIAFNSARVDANILKQGFLNTFGGQAT